MKLALFSESGGRGNDTAHVSYAEDLFEIVTADRLGFEEVWVAERGSRSRGQSPDIVSAANLLICKAAAMTERIRLGTGIRPLPYHHPFTVATEATVCDHLTGGRYMLGYGGTHGVYGDHNLQLGIEPAVQRAMAYEAIDYIMRCFTAEDAFDFDGEFWHGTGINILPKPLQKPYPPIAAACSGSLETIEVAAHNGFIALFGRGGDPAHRIKQMGDCYMEAARGAGRQASRNLFRVVHYVYVSDSVHQAKDELRTTMEPALERQKRGQHWEGLSRWLPEGGTIQDVTFDYLVEAGRYFVGDPDTVYEAIRDFYFASGGFGVLMLLAAQGHTSRDNWERSMELLAEHVMPKLAELDPDRDFAEATA